jgi:hypothetical protein
LIVYDGFGNDFPPLNVAANEGVGLAGVFNGGSNASRDDVQLKYPVFLNGDAFITRAQQFVVHPGIAGLPIGDAAVSVDSLSFMSSKPWFVSKASKATESDTITRKAKDWLDAKRGFFKITDAPLEITRVDGYIKVVRQPAKGFNLQHRQISLITNQTFTETLDDDVPDDEFKTPFYEIVPALTRTFEAFNQLNQFAEVFAIVRWAKRENAKWLGNLAEPKRGPSLTRVLRLPDGGLAVTEEFTDTAAYFRKFIDDVEKHAKAHYEALSQKTYKVASELSAHRLNQLKFALAAEQLRKLKVTDPKDSKPLLDAIRSLEDKVEKEYEAERNVIDSLENENLGLALPSDVDQYSHLRGRVTELSSEFSKLNRQLNELKSIPYRIKFAPPEIKKQTEALVAKHDKLTERFLLTDSSKEEATLQKAITQVKEDLDRLLPRDTKGISELETRIMKTETERSKVRADIERLNQGPLKNRNEFIKVQRQASTVFSEALP